VSPISNLQSFLKLTDNCLSLISFELSIRKNIYKFLSSGDILHINIKLQGYLQNAMLTNRRIWWRV